MAFGMPHIVQRPMLRRGAPSLKVAYALTLSVGLASLTATLFACAAPSGGERPSLPILVEAPPAAAAVPAPDRSNEALTRRFIAEKRAYLARRLDVLRSHGRAHDLPFFRRWARERSAPVAGQPNLTPETRGALQEVFLEEIALRMAAYGFSASGVAALHAQGVDVVEALDIQKSRVRPLRNAAILAEVVAVGEVVGVDPDERLGDGAGVTVRLRVAETLKGSPAVGRVYELRLRSEWVAGQPDPTSLARGARFLLFASFARYRHDAALAGAPARPDRPWLTFNETEMIAVKGDIVEGSHSAPGQSLAALRAELAPLARIWRETHAI